MKENPVKRKIVKTASNLFFQKGFHGTSVREIAKRAKVNVSAISYYFNSKQGLLEYAVSYYYEQYLRKLEETLYNAQQTEPLERLYELIFSIIQYKQENYQFTCFIQRELSMDSVFVREMVVTYLAKENHLLEEAFDAVFRDHMKLHKKRYIFMQLKGMLITPYVLHHWKDFVIGSYSSDLFVKHYVSHIKEWLDFVFEKYTSQQPSKNTNYI
ncbi:MAG TPA: forespore capture DNA-binding protein RefZ [Bacillota bacterium]|nr:forespore capture DNA-binding protein RefZ [Bacillota bacterium]